jgi:hypothetical protein
MTDPVVKRIPPDFYELVKKWYGFLESQYGFRLRFENSAAPGHAADGMVEYRTASTAVVIDSDRGAASVWFYRIQDGKQFCLTPVAIDEYLHTSADEKALLLSTDPRDFPAASALSNRKLLLNQPAWRYQGLKTFEELEKCLENDAGWLREHAGLCLTGDFSRWLEFYEYKVERARAESLRRGEDELVRAMVKDAEGNWQMTKRLIFADQLEHIEKLKKEFAA